MKDAVSFRTRKTSIYDKKSNSPFRISRSKFLILLNLDILWGPSCTFKKKPTPCPVPCW